MPACRRPKRRWSFSGIATERTSGGVTSFEIMTRAGIELVLEHGAGTPRSARRAASLVRADRAVVAAARRPARQHGRHPDARHGARPRARCRHRRQHRAGQGVLAIARTVQRSAAARRRLDQGRHFRAGRSRSGLHQRGERRGRRAHSRRAAAAVRPSRRRQHPLQRHASRSAPTKKRFSSVGAR